MVKVTPATGPAGGISIVQTLGPKSLGDPRVAKTLAEGELHPLGVIMGRCSGLSIRNSKFSDEPAIALVGVFEGLRAGDGGRVRSTSCFLPKAYNEMLVATVKGDAELPIDEMPKLGQKINIVGLNEIPFIIELWTRKSTTEIGFEYVGKMHGHDAFAILDPLADLRDHLPGLALPAPEGADVTRQLAAPGRVIPAEINQGKAVAVGAGKKKAKK